MMEASGFGILPWQHFEQMLLRP